MDVEATKDQYIRAARAHGAATDRGDPRAANRAHDDVIAAVASLRRTSDRGRSFLTGLLEDECAYVRCWAATHLLPLDADLALPALKVIADTAPPFACIDARMVIKEWKAGRLQVP